METEVQIKAEQANQVLANPVFQEAFDGVVEGAIQSIADCPVADSETRNQLGLLISAAQAFKQQLFDHIDTAKLEKAQENETQSEVLPIER